jgi:RNA polymerase sigma-70 factor, ECF subfamily
VDREAWFTRLYQMHYGAVLRYAARRADPDSARDVAAETFLVAWRRPSAVPAVPAAAEAWLYGVARRVLANGQRSRHRAEQLTVRLMDQFRPAEQSADVAAMVAERARVRQALDRLPERDQEVLRLIGWEDLGLAQAAAVMGCTRAAMAVRLHRARRRMMQALRDTDSEPSTVGVTRPAAPIVEEMK